MPQWVFLAAWVTLILAICAGFAWRNYHRQLRALATRRPNPTREQFLEWMRVDVSQEAAEFLWENALFYLEPHATPHPDDDLIKDLPIDNDDIWLDWTLDWATLRGFHESNFPDWPEEIPPTIRNFGRWLDKAPV